MQASDLSCHYLRRLCWSAWVGFSTQFVCLSVSLFVRSITKNKRSQSVQTWCRKRSWDTLEVVLISGSKVKGQGHRVDNNKSLSVERTTSAFRPRPTVSRYRRSWSRLRWHSLRLVIFVKLLTFSVTQNVTSRDKFNEMCTCKVVVKTERL